VDTYSNFTAQEIPQMQSNVIPAHRLMLRVRAKAYGSYGAEPVNALECPYFQQHQVASPCVSSSGGGICGGFYGTTPEGDTLCGWTPRVLTLGQALVVMPEDALASGVSMGIPDYY
jgi:hypothetical protein